MSSGRASRAGALATAIAALTGACSRAPADTEQQREAREAMLFTVASQFREPPGSLGVIEFAPVTWEDDCLEIQRRGPCTQQRTPGYRLRLRRRGETFEYRAPVESPADAALAAGPDPNIGPPALAWTWSAAPGGCQTLLISANARPAVGWCDGPLAEVTWLDEAFSREEWDYFYGTYAPFELRTNQDTFVFAGEGSAQASPSWQRAIERWAALRWSELRAGRSGAAHGRALSYRRPVRDRAGFCDVLEVTEYGVAHLGRSQCEGGGGEAGRSVWLSDELWEQFEGWQTHWAAHSDDATGIHFFGRGADAVDATALRPLTEWADLAMAHVASAARDAWPTR